MRTIQMPAIVHVQTVMLQTELDALKERTGEHHTKDALYKAAEHYLVCVGKKEPKGD